MTGVQTCALPIFALVWQRDELPGGPGHGGLLTPASGLGDVLVQRLRAAGMTLQVDP